MTAAATVAAGIEPPSPWLHAMAEVARKEAMQMIRTKRVLIIGGILLVSLLFTTVVVPVLIFDIGGEFEEGGVGDESIEMFALLGFLQMPFIGGVFLIALLAVVLTSDGVCSEWQRKTVFLVLSKPVPRTAFVVGKFLGASLPLAAIFVMVMVLDFALLDVLLPGRPGAEGWGRFFGALMLLALGVIAFSALGLFFSAITRSTTPSLLLGIVMALIVFPIGSGISDFICLADEACNRDIFGGGEDDLALRYDISHYFTPAAAMNAAPGVMMEEDLSISFSFLFPQRAPVSLTGAVLASVAWTALLLGASMAIVQRRDFE